MPGDYHTEHFLKMYQVIFQDIFDWAGSPRTISIYKEEDVLGGQSVEYSDPFDIVSDIHHVLKDMREKEWDAFLFIMSSGLTVLKKNKPILLTI